LIQAFLGLIFAWLLSEGLYAFKNRNNWVSLGTHFDSHLGWVNTPNYTYTSNGINYTSNKMGFRSPPIDPSADHILILGDSVAYGAGVKEDETISSLLNKSFPQYQTVNMATPGYGVDQYYLLLKRFVEKTRPKIIITMLYTGNDIADTSSESLFGISKPLFKTHNGKLVNLNPEISRLSCQNFFTRSWTNKLISSIKLQNVLCKNRELDFPAVQITIKNLFQQIHNAGNNQNADTIFVLSPTLTGSQWLNCYWKGKPDNCQNLDSGFHQNYRNLKELLEESGLPFLDLNNSFLLDENKSIGKLSTLYNHSGKDFHHYSVKGNRFVANALAEFIKNDLKKLKPKKTIKPLFPEANKKKRIAFNAIKKGEYKSSLELLREISNQYPEHSELYFLKGLSFRGLKLHNQALEAFQKATQLNPEDFQSHNLIGLTNLKTERHLKAIEAFKKSLIFKPDFADGHFNLALALEKIGKGNQAIIHMRLSKNLFQKSKNNLMAGLAQREINSYSIKYKISSPPRKDDFLANRLSYLSQIKKLQTTLTHYPKDLDRRYQLAQKYLDTEQLELAQSEFENLLNLYPTGALIWNDLGYLLIKLNRFEEAAIKFKMALELNPDFANAHFNLATVMEKLGEKEKAINHLEKALAFYRRFDNKKFAKLSEEALIRLSKSGKFNSQN